MKLIHSAWTKPMIENNFDYENKLVINLWLYAYSLHHAKELAEKITLHTDSYGETLFGQLGYDEVKVTLDILQDECSIFWAKGKIIALENEPLGSIHIDGDVFIKDQKMINVLDIQEYDAVVQCEERTGIFMQHYYETLKHYQIALNTPPIGFDFNLKKSLNMGVIGFNNQELKEKYIEGYYSILNQCKESSYYMGKLFIDGNPAFEPNIVIEQFWMAGLCENYNIKNILPIPEGVTGEIETVEIINEIANEIGYCHMWGASKYTRIEEVKLKLKEKNINLYNKVEQLIETIPWQTREKY
jgi:hypothetical protein